MTSTLGSSWHYGLHNTSLLFSLWADMIIVKYEHVYKSSLLMYSQYNCYKCTWTFSKITHLSVVSNAWTIMAAVCRHRVVALSVT